VGAQYADRSALRRQFVDADLRDCGVENAFVDLLAKKSCRWERPGSRGKTIASSGARWLK
jgi:hypothetical protein